MSSGSADVVGKTAHLTHEWEGSVGAFCAIIRPRKSILEGYLAHWLLGPEFTSWRQSQCMGLNIKNLRKAELERLGVPLPPPSEQLRIVEILDQADALRKKRAEADAKATRILPALFYQMFGDASTNPKGWNVCALDSVIESTRNGMYKPAEFYGQGVSILKMFNIQDGELDLTRVDLIQVDDDELETYGLHPGDILMNRVNTPNLVGKCAVITENVGKAVFESKNIRIRLHEDMVTADYVATYLNSPFGHGSLRSGVKHAIGMAPINNTDLRNVRMPLPPIELQHRWTQVVRALRKSRMDQRQSRSRIDALFGNLLHCSFSGNLTAQWREAHMKELLAEMEAQAKALGDAKPKV